MMKKQNMLKNLKRIIGIVLISTFVISALTGCGKKTNNSSSKSTIKIGGIGPVTGDAAIYGTAVKNAMLLAAEEINENGGINGIEVEVKFEDDEHDAEKAVNAYNSLKDWGMVALLGTTTSAPCVAVAAESYNDNIFQLTPSGSSSECTVNDNVFRVCFSDPNQGAASAKYISDNNLAKKVAVIYDSSDVYSTGIYESFVKESSSASFEIVSKEAFTADSNKDFSTQIQKAKDADADLLFLPIYYQQAALILDQAKKASYEPIVFGCDGLDGILTMENFNTSLAEGIMLLTPFSADEDREITKNFVKKYQDKYSEIPNQFAADAYDGMYIIKEAMEKANIDASFSASDICDKIKKIMTEINVVGTTSGEDGITWTADGEPNKQPKAVKIVNGEYISQ